MSRNLIRKGISRRGHIKPVDRLHDGLTFEYRPMLPEEVFELDMECLKHREKQPRQYYRKLAEGLAKRLTKWSEENEDGSDVSITPDNIATLPLPLLDGLRDIICQTRPTDELPDASTQDRHDTNADAGEGFASETIKN